MVEELAGLREREGVSHVYFADQYVDPGFLGDLCDEILLRVPGEDPPCAYLLFRKSGGQLPSGSTDVLWASLILCGVLIVQLASLGDPGSAGVFPPTAHRGHRTAPPAEEPLQDTPNLVVLLRKIDNLVF